MKLEKIILIEIGEWHAKKLASHSQVEPLAIEYLAGYLEKEGYKTKLYQQRGRDLEEIVRDVIKHDPSIIGISCYTYAFPEALHLAKEIKKENPKIKTIIGGYHITTIPKLYDFDFGIIGEGEETLLELIQAIENNEKDFSKIKGLIWKDGNEIIVNERRERMDFSKLPWPKREEKFLDNTIIRGIVGKGSVIQVSYSRGCPYNCYYCCSPLLWQRQISYRKTEDVVEEILWLKNNFNPNYFYFTDLTFNASKKKVLEVTELLKGKNIIWGAMPSIDVGNLDEELIKEMAETGCKRLMFGIETLEQSTSQFLKRKYKIKEKNRFEKTYEIFRLCDKYGIGTRAFLMIGSPNENEEDIKKMLNKLKILLPDEIRIAITTPLPGSGFFEECKEKGLLIYSNFPDDWKHYTTNKLVYKHSYFSLEKIKELGENLFDSYYSSSEYAKHVKEKIRKHQELKEGFNYFINQWLKNKHKVKTKI